MNLSQVSVKKVLASYINLPAASIVILRVSGWLSNIDSPAFLNGIQNTPNPEQYDTGFTQNPQRLQITWAIKAGGSVGSAMITEIEQSQIEELVTADPSAFDL